MERELKKLVGVYAAVESESADPVPAAIAIYQGAIPGMLRTLDPHSVFFDPDQFEQLQQMQASERKGFGTVVSLLPGRADRAADARRLAIGQSRPFRRR